MKLCIVGQGRAGKDTAAHYLAEHTNLRYTHGISRQAAPYVFRTLLAQGFRYATLDECFDDRANHREAWADAIDQMQALDPAIITRELFKEQDIVTGVRRVREFQQVRDEGLADAVIWIDRTIGDDGRPIYDPTQGFGPNDCDLVILNHWGLDEYKQKLHSLARMIGLRERFTSTTA